jgi:hypothetical protein
MTAVGYAVKSMILDVDGVEYQCAVTGVQEGVTAETVTTRTACPDGSKSDTGPGVWTLTVNYNVSNLPASFHRLLRDNEGAAAVVILEPFPIDEPGTTITYNVTLTPGPGDFTVGAFGTASVTLPVNGSPVTTDAP